MHLSKNIVDNATFLFAKIPNCLTATGTGGGARGSLAAPPDYKSDKQSPNKQTWLQWHGRPHSYWRLVFC